MPFGLNSNKQINRSLREEGESPISRILTYCRYQPSFVFVAKPLRSFSCYNALVDPQQCPCTSTKKYHRVSNHLENTTQHSTLQTIWQLRSRYHFAAISSLHGTLSSLFLRSSLLTFFLFAPLSEASSLISGQLRSFRNGDETKPNGPRIHRDLKGGTGKLLRGMVVEPWDNYDGTFFSSL